MKLPVANEPAGALPLPTWVDLETSERIDSALARLKGLFLEMPATTLSIEQAHSLTRLDEITCLALLLALEQGGFLRRSGAGQFLLRVDSTGMDRDQR